MVRRQANVMLPVPPIRTSFAHALVALCVSLPGSACRRADPPADAERAPKLARAASTPTPSVDAPSVDADTPAPTPTPNSFVPLSVDQLASAQVTLRAHLDAGRAALAAKDHATGIAQLQQAAAMSPMHAKILAELGRAYLDAKQLAEAAQTLDRALHHARDAQTRATLLGDLGRVAEARGDLSLATERYASSLAIRPDDALAERLAALTGGMEVISHSACGWTQRGPAPRHLCHAYVQTLERERAPTCAHERTASIPNASASAGEPSAITIYDLQLDQDAKVAVFSYLDHDMAREIFVLNAVLNGIWHSSELTWIDHPRATYADESLAKLELRTRQLAPGGLPELVIEWTIQGRAMDPAQNIEAVWSADRIGVLMLHSGSPRWLIGLTRASTSSDAQIGGDEASTSTSSVEIEWLTKTGEIELRATAHEPSAPLGRFALGAHPQLCPAEL